MTIKKYLDNLDDLKGQKVLVTGGTSGIGLSIVKHLLYKHASVVVLARNLSKANEVKNKLLEQYPDASIEFIQYDQSNDESVITASKEVLSKHQDFYALVLNAGIMQTKKVLSYVDDIPLTIKTNCLGLKLFLDNLLPNLNGNHRFIFQGSVVAGFNVKKVKSFKDKISCWQHYLVSKAAVESLFYSYSQSNEHHSFYLVEPGITSTDIIRDFPVVIRKAGKVFLKIFSHKSDKAALTALLALQEKTPASSFIVPRGLFTFMGYPKIKKFPKKRQREYLLDLLKEAK